MFNQFSNEIRDSVFINTANYLNVIINNLSKNKNIGYTEIRENIEMFISDDGLETSFVYQGEELLKVIITDGNFKIIPIYTEK
jgi:hypothetical protein